MTTPADRKRRPSWEEYFMAVAREVSLRSSCDRASVGCVLVADKAIISTGYNGSIRGADHCDECGHDMEGGHCVRVVHAEMNAVLNAARRGVSTDGAVAYVTHCPCWSCYKALVQAGIRVICYAERYRVDPRIEGDTLVPLIQF